MIKETMTCEERLLAAVHLEPYDRVPVVPLLGQWVVQNKKLPRGLRYKDPARLLKAFKDACDELGGYDAQYVPGFGWPHSSWRISGPAGTMVSAGKRGIPENFSVQYDEQETIHFEDYRKIIDKGWNGFCEEYFPRVTGLSLEQMEKRNQTALALYLEDKKYWEKRGVPVIAGALIVSCEMTLSLGRSFPQFTLDLHRMPDKVQAALEAMVPDFIDNVIRDTKASGVNWVYISLERGSGAYYSLKAYERFFFPQLKKIVDALVAKGIYCWLHMDTDWTLNIPYLRHLPAKKCICNTDSITDIFKAGEILKGHMCVMGDVPPSLTALGTRGEVVKYCEKLIDALSKDSGYIMCSGCEVPIDAKFENVKAMFDTAKSYYPYARNS